MSIAKTKQYIFLKEWVAVWAWWRRRQSDPVGLYIGWFSDAWYFFALHFCSKSHAFAYFALLLFFCDGKGEVRGLSMCIWEILCALPIKFCNFLEHIFTIKILKTYCLVRYLENQLNSLGLLPFIERVRWSRYVLCRLVVAIFQTCTHFLTLKFSFAALICRAHRTQQTKRVWTTDILRWQGELLF